MRICLRLDCPEVRHGVPEPRGCLLPAFADPRRRNYSGTGVVVGLRGSAQAALKYVFRASTVGGIVVDYNALIVVATGIGDGIVSGSPALSGVLGFVGGIGASTRLHFSAGRS